MKSFFAALLTSTIFAHPAFAEVTFPESRKFVGMDEFYVLESFGDWDTLCMKAENGEDFCLANLEFEESTQALALELAVWPSVYPLGDARADVDTVPRAYVSVDPMSVAEHYEDYSAYISKIDDQSFDGFWCNITDEACDRGPSLARAETNQLLSGQTAEIAIFPRLDATNDAPAVATIEVSVGNLRRAFERAAAFNAEILGYDPDEMVETRTCGFKFAGEDRRISYVYDEDYHIENSTFRENMLGSKGGDCPSYVTLAYAAPDATSAQQKLFCLSYDKTTEQYLGFEEGAQNAYGLCKQPKRSFCERVNTSKTAATSIAGFGSGVVGSAVGSANVAGVSVVAHSSGAYILTGTSGYIAGTLGTIGTSALAVLTAPATIAGAAVSVVALGGAVYVCSGED